MSKSRYVRLPESSDPAQVRPVYGVVMVVMTEGSPAEAQVLVPRDDGRLEYYGPGECEAVTGKVAHCDLCGEPFELRDLRGTDEGLLLCATCDATPVAEASPPDPLLGGHRFERGDGGATCGSCGLSIPLCAPLAQFSDADLDAHEPFHRAAHHRLNYPDCPRCQARQQRDDRQRDAWRAAEQGAPR